MTKNDIAVLNKELHGLCIPHGAFKKAFDRGVELMELSDYGMPGSGMVVMGPSGVGKTTLTHALVRKAQKQYGMSSVMRTGLEASTTIKGVLSNLLIGFGDAATRYSTAHDLARRLHDTILNRKCRLIVIDEAQHLIPGGKPSPRDIDNILNAFKTLDETKVSFLMTGMDSILSLWASDTQLRTRFNTTFYLDKFVFPRDVGSWKAVLVKYVQVIRKHGFEIECDEFHERCFAATDGVMRQLVLLLSTAVREAFNADSTTITKNHLGDAAHLQIDDHDGVPNAFDNDISVVRLDMKRRGHALAVTQRGMDDILRK